MFGLEVAIQGKSSSPGKSQSLQTNQGEASQSLGTTHGCSPVTTNAATMLLPTIGKALLSALLKAHGQLPVLGERRQLF